MESELPTELVKCPNCGTLGPNTKFCLSCGTEKSIEDSEARFQDDLVHKLDEIVDITEEEFDGLEEHIDEMEKSEGDAGDNILHDDEPVKNEFIDLKYELDSKVKDNMFDTKKSVDLIIWLVDLYLKESIDEEHLNQFLYSYEHRLDQCLNRARAWSLMLESSKDIEPIHKLLKETKLHLSEIEKKKIIGDISDEEYNLKVPVYKWDIDKYEREIAKRKSELQLLEDITQVVSKKEVDMLKKMAKNSKKTIEDLKKSGNIGPEIATRINEILNKTVDALKSPIKS